MLGRTWGASALHAIYHYYGDPIDLQTVIRETPKLPGGGTLGVHLSVHALSRGYEVDTWVCNTRHMDPTWFQQPTDVLAKLKARWKAKGLMDDPRYGPAIEATTRYRSSDQTVAIADPLLDNPAHGTKYYRVSAYRLLGALFLGVGSDDGNLLLIRPKGDKSPPARTKF